METPRSESTRKGNCALPPSAKTVARFRCPLSGRGRRSRVGRVRLRPRERSGKRDRLRTRRGRAELPGAASVLSTRRPRPARIQVARCEVQGALTSQSSWAMKSLHRRQGYEAGSRGRCRRGLGAPVLRLRRMVRYALPGPAGSSQLEGGPEAEVEFEGAEARLPIEVDGANAHGIPGLPGYSPLQ